MIWYILAGSDPDDAVHELITVDEAKELMDALDAAKLPRQMINGGWRYSFVGGAYVDLVHEESLTADWRHQK